MNRLFFGAFVQIFLSLYFLLLPPSILTRPSNDEENIEKSVLDNFFRKIDNLIQIDKIKKIDNVRKIDNLRKIDKFEKIDNSNANFQTDSSLSSKFNFECLLCKLFAVEILGIYSQTKSKECLAAILIQLCQTLHIEESRVCSSIIGEFSDEVLYVLGQLLLRPAQFCGLLMPSTCGRPYDPLNPEWSVKLPNTTKPPVEKPFLPPDGSPTLRIIQITDVHFDKLYEVGSNVNCNEPLCCRQFQTSAFDKDYQPAGFWGSSTGNCDIPFWTLENLLQHINKSEKFDYILWTGDLPPHNVWNQTRNDQLEAYDVLTKLFLKYFPNKMIYSAVGNHESSPVDSFPPHFKDLPPQYSVSWLYNALSVNWTNWIDKSQSDRVKSIASYVVKPFPNLRIISLNTLYCYPTNFWIYLNETDPDGVLAWLVDVLQDAENAGDKVHIISHVPPTECLEQWRFNYYKVINRYENTVRAQFFGHTHNDQFGVFYENDDQNRRATNLYYAAPSITTFSNRNPAYRVYLVDGNYSNSTFRVLNHYTYYLNLSEANKNNLTNWKIEYDAKEAYGLKTLFPQEWSDLIVNFERNDSFFNLYSKFYLANENDCDAVCKKRRICELRLVARTSQDLCNRVFSAESILLDGDFLDGEPLLKKMVKNAENLIENLYFNFKTGFPIPPQCKSKSPNFVFGNVLRKKPPSEATKEDFVIVNLPQNYIGPHQYCFAIFLLSLFIVVLLVFKY